VRGDSPLLDVEREKGKGILGVNGGDDIWAARF